MPVNLTAKPAAELFAVPGVRLFTAQAGVKTGGRDDVTVMDLGTGANVAGVFTRNRFCAAPVVVAREHLALGKSIRALIVNTGNANAGTGEAGREAARILCRAVAALKDCAPEEVLPFSTGVILEPLPADKIVAALARLQEVHWDVAARAIMTTDTTPKAASRRVEVDGIPITITGMAKGAGMIHPNMATMLGFIATDAAIALPLVQTLVREVADESFNTITVDGDTSTNDSFMIAATAQAALPELTGEHSTGYAEIKAALIELAQELSQAIVRDGEGATKFIRVLVDEAHSRDEARQVGYAVARSPLVKTAFFASDPNLGRILCAIGYAGIADLDVDKVRVWLGDVLVAEHGGRAAAYTEEAGQRVMAEPEITVHISLGRGSAQAWVYTCDFSYDYVKINADYRS